MKKALLLLALLPLLAYAAPKTIPQLNEATTATGNAVVPMDSGTQSFRMSFTNLAKLMHSLFFPVVQTKAENYQILATDSIVRGSGDRTFTMPDATTCSGKEFAVYKTDAVGTTITIAFLSGQTAGGASTLSLTEQYGFYRLKSNGANFDIVGTPKVFDGTVSTTKIVDNAVTTAKIADANVTTAKIADGAVTAAKRASATYSFPAGGSVTNHTSTSYSSAIVTSASVTATGRPYLITIGGGGAGIQMTRTDASAGEVACTIGLFLDASGSELTTATYRMYVPAAGLTAAPASLTYIDVPSAGAHTWNIKVARGGVAAVGRCSVFASIAVIEL